MREFGRPHDHVLIGRLSRFQGLVPHDRCTSTSQHFGFGNSRYLVRTNKTAAFECGSEILKTMVVNSTG